MISEQRRANLQRIADDYAAWEAENLPRVQFDPGRSRTGSDYNQHYLDYEADGTLAGEQERPRR